ncbi:MAG TPA: FMN-binding negative transcriptional regulator [Candidatus Tumulicola sp.]|nr:FMN-binding negative transcriptional regulator [Candidatus Tumulicola sp.]
MYVPPEFRIAERDRAVGLIERHPFATLVTAATPYPRVSLIPIVHELRDDALWLVGHVARGNPHAASIEECADATVVFTGPHAYISASWYERPYETVPTWNYVAVHICGRLQPCDAWRAVRLLSGVMERGRPDAWDPERLEPAYRQAQLRGIVAFELRAEKIYAKAKLSQNRTATDRARVLAHLAASPAAGDRACAAAMEALVTS